MAKKSKTSTAVPARDEIRKLYERTTKRVRRRPKGAPAPWPPLSITDILRWADLHHERTGRWPSQQSGPVPDTIGEVWTNIDQSLRKGQRGLPGGSSLAKLLAQHRGKRNRLDLPPLTIDQVLKWSDAFHRRTGRWPLHNSGPIPEAPGETWAGVDFTLRNARRGIRQETSLARVLETHRGVVNYFNLPPLSYNLILKWADAHHERTGRWPVVASGKVLDAPDEKWIRINSALMRGARGLPGGSSLAQLLEGRRNVSNPANRPRLTEKQILDWADEHHRRKGDWPLPRSGRILGTENEDWSRINTALIEGLRGLPGADSLAKLLARSRGRPPRIHTGDLSVEQVLAWADDHRRRTGKWPTPYDKLIPGTLGEHWYHVNKCLKLGLRGLPVAGSLAKFLQQRRGAPHKHNKPRLSIQQILRWADEHHARTGRWPSSNSGIIPDSGGEKWPLIDQCMWRGDRGLPGGSSLAKLMHKHRGKHVARMAPKLTIRQVLAWADEHHRRTGRWPANDSGEIPGSDGVKWANINQSLVIGGRGLPGGTTLSKLLDKHRRKKRGS